MAKRRPKASDGRDFFRERAQDDDRCECNTTTGERCANKWVAKLVMEGRDVKVCRWCRERWEGPVRRHNKVVNNALFDNLEASS